MHGSARGFACTFHVRHSERQKQQNRIADPKVSNTASLRIGTRENCEAAAPEFDDLASLLRNRRNVAGAELVRLVGHFLAARAKSDSRDHRGKNDGTLHSQSPLDSPVMGSTLNARLLRRRCIGIHCQVTRRRSAVMIQQPLPNSVSLGNAF